MEPSTKTGLVSVSPDTNPLCIRWDTRGSVGHRRRSSPSHAAKAFIRAEDLQVLMGLRDSCFPDFALTTIPCLDFPLPLPRHWGIPLSLREYLDLLKVHSLLWFWRFWSFLDACWCPPFTCPSLGLPISGPGTVCWEAHLTLCKLLRPRAPFQLADWLANPATRSTTWHLGHTLCRPPVATRRGAWLGTQGPPLCAKQFEPAWLLFLERLPYAWMASTWTAFLSSPPTPPVNRPWQLQPLHWVNQSINSQVPTEHHGVINLGMGDADRM